IFSIAGHDRIFEERAATGTIYVGTTFAAIGFSDYTSSSTGHFRALISLASGSGAYQLTFNNSASFFTGTMSVISCGGVPARADAGEAASASLPDFATAAPRP